MARLTLKEQTEPSTPDTGYATAYVDSADSNLKYKTDDGIVHTISDVATVVQAYGGALAGATITGSIDSSNLVFVLPSTPTSASRLRVYVNGSLMRNATLANGGQYQLSGATITFNTGCAPETGQGLDAIYS